MSKKDKQEKQEKQSKPEESLAVGGVVEPGAIYELGESAPLEEAIKAEVKKVAPVPKREVRSSRVELIRIASIRNAGVCVVEDAEGNGYVVPLNTKFVSGKMKGDPSKMEKAYSWNDEIAAMLPDQDTLIRNIRRSIWASGGFEKGAGRVPRRLDQAWPYRINEE